MTQYGFYFDSSRCTGCKTCQVVCKECHHLPTDNLYRRVYHYAGGSWEATEGGHHVPSGTFGYQISLTCNHCAEPACVAVCPTGAMSKNPETGIVSTDHDVCIGCRSCMSACPYGHPSFDQENRYVIKCDMCEAEVNNGSRPFCVDACPMRALDWGDYDQLAATYGAGDVEVAPLPRNITKAHLVLKPHPDAKPNGDKSGSIVSLDEEL